MQEMTWQQNNEQSSDGLKADNDGFISEWSLWWTLSIVWGVLRKKTCRKLGLPQSTESGCHNPVTSITTDNALYELDTS
jgi:hypothetical protein